MRPWCWFPSTVSSTSTSNGTPGWCIRITRPTRSSRTWADGACRRAKRSCTRRGSTATGSCRSCPEQRRARDLRHPRRDAGRVALRIPRVHLVLALPAPRVEGVVHHHPVREHLVVVVEIARQAERDGRQSGGLGCERELRGIGRTHDERELLERGIAQAVVPEERIEAAALALVRKMH